MRFGPRSWNEVGKWLTEWPRRQRAKPENRFHDAPVRPEDRVPDFILTAGPVANNVVSPIHDAVRATAAGEGESGGNSRQCWSAAHSWLGGAVWVGGPGISSQVWGEQWAIGRRPGALGPFGVFLITRNLV